MRETIVSHFPDGAYSDDGYIEAKIVGRFGDFDEDFSTRLEATGVLDESIGPIESLDRKDGSLTDNEGLTDVEIGEGPGDPYAVFDAEGIGGVMRRRDRPDRGETFIEKGPCIENNRTGFLDLGDDGPEDGVGIAGLELPEDLEGLEIGMDTLEKPTGRNLPDHEDGTRIELAEGTEEGTDLSYLYGYMAGRRKKPDGLIGSFALEGHKPDIDAGLAGCHDTDTGVGTAAGNDDQRGGFAKKRAERGFLELSHIWFKVLKVRCLGREMARSDAKVNFSEKSSCTGRTFSAC